MLARPGPIPRGDYAFELKWDGLQAIVSRNGDFHVRSRRGWNMTPSFPSWPTFPPMVCSPTSLSPIGNAAPS
jgi:ATP-dependent DNA ligase